MSDYVRDNRIDQYINNLPDWQQEICEKVRELVHKTDKNVIETIKRTDRPYFVLNGNICALQATKDHINIFIYDPIVSDPEGVINQGEGNLTARTIQAYKSDSLNERALLNLFKGVVANNKAGGWRKLQD